MFFRPARRTRQQSRKKQTAVSAVGQRFFDRYQRDEDEECERVEAECGGGCVEGEEAVDEVWQGVVIVGERGPAGRQGVLPAGVEAWRVVQCKSMEVIL